MRCTLVKRAINISLLTVLLTFTHCALFGGGEGSVVHSKTYRTSVPQQWNPQDRGEGDEAFQLDSGAVVTLTSSCGKNNAYPLETLTKQLLIGARKIKIIEQKRKKVSGGEGLYSVVTAVYDGVPMNLVLFVIPIDSCVFDFTLLKRQSPNEKELKEFNDYLQSFNYVKSGN
jgi:hypothetical protein